MWTLSHFTTAVTAIYNEPEVYGDWQSREPEKPRIVYKLAGLSKLGVPNRLLVTTGFDLERVRQLIAFYEPDKTALCVQTGAQQNNAVSHRKTP